ncbi:MAG: hypothetical protein PHQ75_05425 [Thermoguttaceae bacterium]|nr:hypothetical protein [Thermoguttaceae bacterium]
MPEVIGQIHFAGNMVRFDFVTSADRRQSGTDAGKESAGRYAAASFLGTRRDSVQKHHDKLVTAGVFARDTHFSRKESNIPPCFGDFSMRRQAS